MTSHEVAGDAGGEAQGARRLCPATTRAGRVCNTPALRDDPAGFCWVHSTLTAEKRKEWQRRGGATTIGRRAILLGTIDLSTPESCCRFFESLVRATLRGEVAVARSKAASEIAEALLRVRGGVLLDERMSAVEQLLADLGAAAAGRGNERTH
jgi:hypothetical protein